MHCSMRGKGEAVRFIHGMPTNGRLWDGVVLDLERHCQCFVVDLPGMGGTPFLPYTPAYFAQVAAQIEGVRIRHRVQRRHIVGHDGGCAVSDARNKPQRASFFENFAGLAGPWKLMRLVRWGNPQIVLQEFPSILRDLPCPTLVINGSRDVLPESFARRAADLIRDAQLIALDSGHFIPLERPGQVAQKLLAHFNPRGAKPAQSDSPGEGAASRSGPSEVKQTRRRPELVPLPAAR